MTIYVGLDNSSDNVTHYRQCYYYIIDSTIVIVDMWLQACAFDIVSPRHTHSQVKKHTETVRNISDEIDLDKELQVFLLEGSKSDV